MTRPPRAWLWGPLATLALLAVMPLALLAILNTQPGQSWLETQINQRAAPYVHIEGLNGVLPGHLALSSLTLADPQGPWLSATGLSLSWSPWALLSHHLAIGTLSAQTLAIPRPPAYGGTTSHSPSLSWMRWRLSVGQLALPHISLGAALAGEPMALSAQGGLHNASQLTLAVQRLDAPGHLTLTGPLANAKLDLTAPLRATTLTAQGTLGLLPGAFHAALTLTATNLAPLTASRLAGPVSAQVTATPSAQGEQLGLTLAPHFTSAPPAVLTLLGATPQLTAQAHLTSTALALDTLTLTGPRASLTATGTLSPQALALETTLTLPDISALSPSLAGHATLHAALSGPTGNLTAHLALTGQADARNAPKAGPFALTLTANHLPSAPQGRLTGTGSFANAPLTLSAAFACTTLTACQAKLPAATWRSLHATGQLTLTQALPTGTLTFAIGHLADLTPLLPQAHGLTGALTAQFAYQGGEDIAASLQTQNAGGLWGVRGLTARFTAKGKLSALPLTLTAHAQSLHGAPASLTATGLFTRAANRLTLSALTASWNNLPAALTGPATLSTAQGWALTAPHVTLAGATGAVTGTFTPALNATANLANLPLRQLGKLWPALAGLTGTATATARLTGTLAHPTGTLTLAVANVTAPQTSGLPPLQASAQPQLRGTTATLTAHISGDDKLALTAQGQVPLTATAPLALHLTGHAQAALLNPWLDASGTALKGTAALDLTLTGAIGAPRVTGTLSLTQGDALNIGAGLHLSNIDTTATLTSQTLTLTRFTAQSGHGTLNGQGQISLALPTWPLTLTLTATNAQPVQTDLLSATTSGTLTLSGGLRGALTLAGTLDISRALITIPKSLPENIAVLPILQKGAPPPPPKPPSPWPPLSCDIALNAPRDILIQGDGLNAEFGGHMRLTSAAGPLTPLGAFTLIRGQLTLAGHLLTFTSGRVSFTGEGYAPTLDIEASTTTSAGTATLIIGGTAAAPTITLTSTPPAPSDEVLAQLLFGQSSSSLSPFQAASLALAVAQLSGVGSALNPIDKLRSTLGLDQLSVGSDSTGAPTVQAGRYIAPGIYVGAAQSTTGQGTSANVEINLGHGLHLNSSTGTTTTGTASSVGLSYQFDY
ncbi:translocation/assembly module TamB domain-containing protein [Acidocella sp.]|uniref:translocation/assembly module TamB domain-containing protein n=1 Tax=Acidocella sp. TaxID=50710 RepID=UPI002631EBD5|nr:translocation/assembly module TamB domain-containing protein [Acidocella sp.]